MTVSHHIWFGTVQHLLNQKGPAILAGLKVVIQIYHQCGFHVTHIFMDGQSEPLCREISVLGIQLNTASNDKHVDKLETQIHTGKEQMHAIHCTLPFYKMPQ